MKLIWGFSYATADKIQSVGFFSNRDIKVQNCFYFFILTTPIGYSLPTQLHADRPETTFTCRKCHRECHSRMSPQPHQKMPRHMKELSRWRKTPSSPKTDGSLQYY